LHPSDPRAVDPVLGDLDAVDRLVAAAHWHGLRVLVDIVVNHTSDGHEWFRAALAAAPGSPERARYHFRPGRGPGGGEPPNNWSSVDGGPAWTQVPDGEWYLHLFTAGQPDLNWTNPEVWADLEKTLRFWLDRAVDGFRIAVAHGMSKPDGLPDSVAAVRTGLLTADPRFDQDGVHDVHRMIRAVVDHYPGRIVVGDIPVPDGARFGRYLRPDELHLGSDRRLLRAPFTAIAVRQAVEHSLAAAAAVSATPTWALAGHDAPRPATRYGGGELGTARARAMSLVALALPGAVILHNGEELGLPDVGPGVRGPLPWEGAAPGYGFTSGTPWPAIPEEYGRLTVAGQLEDTRSGLSLLRRAIELRRTHPGFAGTDVEWFGAPAGCLAFRRAGSTLVCALNTSAVPVPLPPGDVLLCSRDLDDDLLPPDTGAWLA
jgi:alpha-glucosidase